MGDATPPAPGRVLVASASPGRGQLLSRGLQVHGHRAAHVSLTGDELETTLAGASSPVLLVADRIGERLGERLLRLRREHPTMRVLVLQDDGGRDPLPESLDGEPVPLHIGIRRLAEVVADRRPVPVAASAGVRRPASPPSTVVDRLTTREREVLDALLDGLSRDAIATRLDISPHTVRTHLQNLFAKLGVHNQLEAVSVGLRAGLRSGEGSGVGEEVA